jgi:hypothetical protein
VKAIQSSENIATPRAIEAVAEQAEAAANVPAGINGDQAIDLSCKASGNLVIQVLRETEFFWKEYRAGIYRAAGTATFAGLARGAVVYRQEIVSFIAKHADALKGFVKAAWHNPALGEIIDHVVRVPIGF